MIDKYWPDTITIFVRTNICARYGVGEGGLVSGHTCMIIVVVDDMINHWVLMGSESAGGRRR